jgi:hypothetical protein
MPHPVDRVTLAGLQFEPLLFAVGQGVETAQAHPRGRHVANDADEFAKRVDQLGGADQQGEPRRRALLAGRRSGVRVDEASMFHRVVLTVARHRSADEPYAQTTVCPTLNILQG